MAMGNAVLRDEAASGAWHAGLTPRHWRILWGAYLGWIFDGYEAVALVYALGPALKALLTPEQARTTPWYLGLAIGITLLGWGIGGLAGGVAADYIGRKRMMLISILGYALLTGPHGLRDELRGPGGPALHHRPRHRLRMEHRHRAGGRDLARPRPAEGLRLPAVGVRLRGASGGAGLAAHPGRGHRRRRALAHHVRARRPAGLRLPLPARRDGGIGALDGGGARAGAGPPPNRPDEAPSSRTARPFSLAEIFREPESRRRVLLATAVSFAATVGWWAVSSWLPALHGRPSPRRPARTPPSGVRASAWSTIAAPSRPISWPGFVADAIGRRAFLVVTYAGCLVVTALTYTWTGSLGAFAALAFVNGFFTLGFSFCWMAIYLAELFTSPVRATASSFVFNGARMVAWVFPIIAGQIVGEFGGVSATRL